MTPSSSDKPYRSKGTFGGRRLGAGARRKPDLSEEEWKALDELRSVGGWGHGYRAAASLISALREAHTAATLARKRRLEVSEYWIRCQLRDRDKIKTAIKSSPIQEDEQPRDDPSALAIRGPEPHQEAPSQQEKAVRKKVR